MNQLGRKNHLCFVIVASLLVLPSIAQGSSCVSSSLAFNCTTINDQVDNNPPNTPTAETFTQLLGINNAGMVAGYYGSGMDVPLNHPNKGFVVPNIFASTPTFTHENPPGSVQTQVFGITNTTVPQTTVGFYIDDMNIQHGFVGTNGTTFVTLDDSPGGVAQPVNQLLGLNDHNMAAGFYQDSNNVFHAYTVNLTGTPVFNPVGPANSMATDINNTGEITGFTFTNADNTTAEGFLINGTQTTILQVPGSNFTQAFGLNNTGEVVGDYMDDAGVLHGFIYFVSTGQYVTLDPSNSTATTLNGINDLGDIVGFYMDGMTGEDGVPNTNGLLVTAVPEPGFLALIGIGAIAIGLWRRASRRR